MNDCGDCDACCVVLKIENFKEGGVPCENLCEKGCSIYNDPSKPSACSEFNCVYKANTSWSENLRPDKSGVMIVEFKDRITAYRISDDVSDDTMKMIDRIKEKYDDKILIGIDARESYA